MPEIRGPRRGRGGVSATLLAPGLTAFRGARAERVTVRMHDDRATYAGPYVGCHAPRTSQPLRRMTSSVRAGGSSRVVNRRIVASFSASRPAFS
jgi:hypothetical protein